MHFETQRMLFKNNPKKIYVYTSQGCIHREYISALLEKRYNGLIKIVRNTIINLTNESLQDMEIDIIISNVNLPIKIYLLYKFRNFLQKEIFMKSKR